MTVTEWIEGVDPEGIYDDKELGDALRRDTGLTPAWPTHSLVEIKSMIVARGGSGAVADCEGPLVYGREAIASLVNPEE